MRTRGVAGFGYYWQGARVWLDMQLPEPNFSPRGDPFACFRMVLISFWVSSFSVNCYSASSSIAGKRGVRAPFMWARQNEFRLALVSLLAYIA
jgi:hypothetical protein